MSLSDNNVCSGKPWLKCFYNFTLYVVKCNKIAPFNNFNNVNTNKTNSYTHPSMTLHSIRQAEQTYCTQKYCNSSTPHYSPFSLNSNDKYIYLMGCYENLDIFYIKNKSENIELTAVHETVWQSKF